MSLPWRCSGISRRPHGPQDSADGGGNPLEIDRRGRQVGLDLHVVEAAADGAAEPLPGIRLPVEALGAPEVALV